MTGYGEDRHCKMAVIYSFATKLIANVEFYDKYLYGLFQEFLLDSSYFLFSESDAVPGQVVTIEIASPFCQIERQRFPRLVDPRLRAPSQEN